MSEREREWERERKKERERESERESKRLRESGLVSKGKATTTVVLFTSAVLLLPNNILD